MQLVINGVEISLSSNISEKLEKRVEMWSHPAFKQNNSDPFNAKLHGYLAALLDVESIDVNTAAYLYKKYSKNLI